MKYNIQSQKSFCQDQRNRIITILNLTHNTYGSSIHKTMPSGAKRKFSHEAQGQAKVFLHIVGHSIAAFVDQPRNNCMKIHHMSFNHTTDSGSRKIESIRQRLPMPGITRNCYRFPAWIIAQDGRKFLNCGTEFNNFKSKHMIFRISKFHNGMKEIPLDFDIPQSLNSLQFVGCKIGLGTKIKALNLSVDITNC